MATKAAELPKASPADIASTQIKHFDSLRNILKNARHSSGADLYTHLVDVMNHIVMHCPESGLDKFEEISYLLKQQREGKIHNLSEFLRVTEDRQYCRPGKEMHVELTARYLSKAKKYFDVRLCYL
jgi:Radial spokehead-like protein